MDNVQMPDCPRVETITVTAGPGVLYLEAGTMLGCECAHHGFFMKAALTIEQAREWSDAFAAGEGCRWRDTDETMQLLFGADPFRDGHALVGAYAWFSDMALLSVSCSPSATAELLSILSGRVDLLDGQVLLIGSEGGAPAEVLREAPARRVG